MSDERLSGYDIERRTSKKISQSYINRVRKGFATNLSLNKLQILAAGLGRSEAEVIAAAYGSPTHDRLAGLNAAYALLSSEKQETADRLIDMIERELRRMLDE